MPLFRRKDADYVGDVPAFRRIMPYIMPTRTESAVYFEQRIDATKALEFIKSWNERHPDLKTSLLHLCIYGTVQSLHDRPRLNRFTVGGHLYQRKGIWISYSAKKAINDDSPIVVVKQKFEASQTFSEVVAQIHGAVKEGRSDKESHVDKELDLFLKLPAPILRRAARLLRWLDAWNLLPYSYIEKDPLYASLFFANLGSVKLASAYHHLYEYGNIALFGVLGRIQEVPVPNGDGTISFRPELSIKWSHDERVEDGLYTAASMDILKDYLENPAKFLEKERKSNVMRAV